MKKIGIVVSSALFLLSPATSFAANLSNLNGLTTATQTFATTTGTTTMHLKIASSGSVHTFSWDNSPWTVAQGGTGQTSFTSGQLIFGNGTGALSTDGRLKFGDDGSGNGVLTIGGGSATTYIKNVAGATLIDSNRLGVTGDTLSLLGDDSSGYYLNAEGAGFGLLINSPSPGAVVSLHGEGAGTAVFDVSAISGDRKFFSFPNLSGTFGLHEANQTWTGANTFSQGPVGTTTVTFGTMGSSTSHTCFNTKTSNGQDMSFYFNNNFQMVIEQNSCQ